MFLSALTGYVGLGIWIVIYLRIEFKLVLQGIYWCCLKAFGTVLWILFFKIDPATLESGYCS